MISLIYATFVSGRQWLLLEFGCRQALQIKQLQLLYGPGCLAGLMVGVLVPKTVFFLEGTSSRWTKYETKASFKPLAKLSLQSSKLRQWMFFPPTAPYLSHGVSGSKRPRLGRFWMARCLPKWPGAGGLSCRRGHQGPTAERKLLPAAGWKLGAVAYYNLHAIKILVLWISACIFHILLNKSESVLM